MDCATINRLHREMNTIAAMPAQGCFIKSAAGMSEGVGADGGHAVNAVRLCPWCRGRVTSTRDGFSRCGNGHRFATHQCIKSMLHSLNKSAISQPAARQPTILDLAEAAIELAKAAVESPLPAPMKRSIVGIAQRVVERTRREVRE